MAVSTIFPKAGKQVWVAESGPTEICFPGLQDAQEFLGTLYGYAELSWEETMATRSGQYGERETYPCSQLMLLAVSSRFGGDYPRQSWLNTGWKLWRQQ